MNQSKSILIATLASLVVGLTSCGSVSGGRIGAPTDSNTTRVQLFTPRSVSPGSIKAPAMTLVRANYAMPGSGRSARSTIRDPRWMLLTGGATQVTTAGDGSFWVLSPDGPNANDKYIYHFLNGTWTEIPGAATRIAAGFGGRLWAVNSLGGIYLYDGAWLTIAGGAKDIAVGFGGIFVLSNVPGDAAIWELLNERSSLWRQLPGSGTTIAADLDSKSHGRLSPGPFYLTNSFGEIYKAERQYFDSPLDYAKIVATASRVAPTSNGGLFLLGFPVTSHERPITYYDLDIGTGTQLPGGAAAIDIAADSSTLYAISERFEIWSTSVQQSAPVVPTIGYLPVIGTNIIGAQLVNSRNTTVVGVSPVFPQYVNLYSTVTESVSGVIAATNARETQAATQAKSARAAVGPFQENQSRHFVDTNSGLPVRFVGHSTQAKRATAALPSVLGSAASFWVASGVGGKLTPSHLKAVTAHGAIWTDDRLTVLSQAQIDQIASDFETTYATVVNHFGTPNYTSGAPGYQATYQTCDTNGRPDGGSNRYFITPTDTKIAVEIVNPSGVPGGVVDYFSRYDLSPQGIASCLAPGSQSNEAPILFIAYNGSNGAASTAKSDAFELGEHVVAAMAHQLQHLINFVHHTVLYPVASQPSYNAPYYSELPFIDEGLSMLAQDFAISAKYPSLALDVADTVAHAQLFLLDPTRGNLLDNYYSYGAGFSLIGSTSSGGQYLFQRYLYDRFGGDAYLKASLDRGQNGQRSLEAITGAPLGTLFVDFGLALAASGTGVTSDSRWTFQNFNPRGSYTDQFGTAIALSGPSSTGALDPGTGRSLSLSGGTMFFYSGPTTINTILRIEDVYGRLNLMGGMVQW